LACFINFAIFFRILFGSKVPFFKKIKNKTLGIYLLIGVILLTIFLPNYDIKVIARGVFMHHSTVEFLKKQKQATKILFYKETPYLTISVHQVKATGDKYLKFNGHAHCSNTQTDLSTTRGLAVYPYETFVKTFGSRPRTAVNIGLGCGMTSGWLAESNVKTTSFDLDKAVIQAAEYFKELNWDVNNHKNNTTIIADARHWLATHPDEKYNIIISEPADPWTIQSTYLFSQEFFQIVKEHLTEKGIFSVWVPIFDMNLEDFKIIYNTFHSVFPNTYIYINRAGGNELIFLGSENALKPVPMNYLGNIGDYAKQARINTDDYPILEFQTAFHLYADYPRKEIINEIRNNSIDTEIK
jgi:spermidine synthase